MRLFAPLLVLLSAALARAASGEPNAAVTTKPKVMLTRFSHHGLLAALLWLACGWPAVAADSAATPGSVGTVEWTRLITRSPYWGKHSRNDGQLLEYIAAHTHFKVEERVKATPADDLTELCRHPFVFAHDVSELTATQASNLAEYMKRGGFVCIDYCANPNTNPQPSIYIEGQKKSLLKQLPQLEIIPLQPRHEIFTTFFKMKRFPPQQNGGWLKNAPTIPLLGLQLEGRLVGVIAANGFHCSWDNPSDMENATACMQMVTNIYVYAMTH